MNEYEHHFNKLIDTFEQIKREEHRKDGFKICRLYLEEFYKQLIAPNTDYKDSEKILQDSKFMSRLTSVILLNLNDYHDTIKDEAQLLLVSMTQRFLPP